jgi:hypothetical protein
VPKFAQQANGFHPPETFFDPLPLPLAHGIARVPRRSPINRTPTPPPFILGHMRRHLQIPALGHKIPGVIALVSGHRHSLSRNLLHHG